jgi:hypothetical protein
MRHFRILLACACLVIGVACSDPSANREDPTEEIAGSVEASQSVLARAEEAAVQYGRTHLGHFLDLRLSDLEDLGLQARSSFDFDLRTDHSSFCIRVTNNELPSVHPWHVGTVTSKGAGPTSTDSCAR